MPININCPECNMRLQAPDSAAGKKVKCPKCGGVATVPPQRAASVPVDERMEPPTPTRPRPVAPAQAERPYPERPSGAEPLSEYPEVRGYSAPPRKAINGLGIASVIVSSIGLLFSLIPCLGWIVGVPVSSIGLLLGAIGLIVALATKKQGIATPIAGLAVGLVSITISVGYFWFFSRIATAPERAVAEADKNYDQGKRAEAVAVYKENFYTYTLQSERQRQFVKRIVEHELQQGNTAEARRWIKKGLDLNLDVTFEAPAARELAKAVEEELRGPPVERPNPVNGGGDEKPGEASLRLARATLKGHKSSVTSLAYSPDGKLLASGSDDDTVKLWDATTGREHATLEGHGNSVLSVSFSPDSKTLASGSQDKSIKLWDVTTGKVRTTLKDPKGEWVTSVAFSPDGKTLASANWKPGEATITLWDVATEKVRATLRGHKGSITLAWGPDSKILASGCRDRFLKLWNVEPGREQPAFETTTTMVYALAFAPDGKTLAWGGDSGVKLLDVQTKQERALKESRAPAVVGALAYSPDSKTLASGSTDNAIMLWDVATSKGKAVLKGHTDYVNAVAYSPDGKTLASGSKDDTIKLWTIAGATPGS
jgi:tricorn protease-like protein